MDKNFDFSSVNLQYLIQLRDIARQNPGMAPSVLGLSPKLVSLLANANAGALVGITQIKTPLFIPRSEPWWWARLLLALE